MGTALAEGIALLRQGDAPAAIAALRQDASPLARLNLGLALMDSGAVREAEAVLQDLRASGACSAELVFRLALLAGRRGETAAARALLGETLSLAPGHVPARVALARLTPDAAEARALLDQARATSPDDAAVQAEAAAAAGDAATLRRLLAADPENGRLGAQLAASLLAGGSARGALDELAAAPPAAGAAVASAILLAATDDPPAALAQWRLAALLNPDDAAAAAGLAEALGQHGAWDEAAAAFRRAAALDPASVALPLGEAGALFRAHRLEAAAATLEEALGRLGPNPAVSFNLAAARASQGRQEEGLAIALAQAPGETRDFQLLAAIGPYAESEADAGTLARHARSLHARLARDAASSPPRRARRGGRLRVGLLSPGFGRHPVGWLALAGLEHLPRDEFALVGCTLRHFDDPLARRFRALAGEWHDMPAQQDDAALAARLRALDLDILLDLGGHGEGGRAAALRLRPAPVQVKWVGAQSATTGVPGLDWMLTDRWETPPGHEAFFTERLLRLPDGYVCYTAPPYAPPVGPLPALSRGHVTFGCFNNLLKVTRGARRAWARILQAVPGSRLVLRTHALGDPPTREAFRHLAVSDGIPEDRLDLAGPLPHNELLAAYGDVDISLDAFPYSGGLTVCESLFMGVPVVALAGSHFAGRHALSHLSNTGLDAWVGEDPDAYVRTAIRHAADLPALAALRAGLRERLRGSPLMDAPRFGANLAAALHRAWAET